MALASPDQVVLSAEEHRTLTARARSGRAAHRDVLRARIVLAAAAGTANAQIARWLGICEDT
jgi:DNA-binding NarL/FixJ family response regulator